MFTFFLEENKIEYYIKLVNRKADDQTKKALLKI